MEWLSLNKHSVSESVGSRCVDISTRSSERSASAASL